MSVEQKQALQVLNTALELAMACGALDCLQGSCDSPDSINDICDAVTAAIHE